jgi:hypothetical protein
MHQAAHFDSVGMSLREFFQNYLECFFAGHISSTLLLRVLDRFFFHGLYAFAALGLGILIASRTEILNCFVKEQLIATLKQLMLQFSFRDVSEGYTQLSPKQFGEDLKLCAVPPSREALELFRLPTLRSPLSEAKKTSLLDRAAAYTIWSWLPYSLRLSNPCLLFATQLHGYSLDRLRENLFSAPRNYEAATLLLVRDTEGAVFGAFISDRWPRAKARQDDPISLLSYRKPERGETEISPSYQESFLFSLTPRLAVFFNTEPRVPASTLRPNALANAEMPDLAEAATSADSAQMQDAPTAILVEESSHTTQDTQFDPDPQPPVVPPSPVAQQILSHPASWSDRGGSRRLRTFSIGNELPATLPLVDDAEVAVVAPQQPLSPFTIIQDYNGQGRSQGQSEVIIIDHH